MTVVYQNLALKGPVTHALIVGVSAYPALPDPGKAGQPETFGLHRLTSPALSALRFRQALQRMRGDLVTSLPDRLEPAPLASIRMLVSPSAEEMEVEPRLRRPYRRPTVENFIQSAREWQSIVCRSVDNVGIFFFAGHGIQVSKDNVLMLFDDFSAPDPFGAAVALRNIVGGMAPSQALPEPPRNQFYFLDACRVQPGAGGIQLQPGRTVFPEYAEMDDRAAPIVYAAASGAAAHSRPAASSFFCDALVEGMDMACSEAQRLGAGQLAYPVTIHGLLDAMNDRFRAWSLNQKAMMGGSAPGTTAIRNLTGPPLVEFEIALAPDECVKTAEVQVKQATGGPVATFSPAPADHPYTVTLPMGFYSLHARRGEGQWVDSEGEVVTFRRSCWPLTIPAEGS